MCRKKNCCIWFGGKCEICVSYGIGMMEPINIVINTFNTHKTKIENVYKFVLDNFDFSPDNIIKELNLIKPIYAKTSCFGHFGRNEFSWKKIKDIINIKKYFI